MRRPLKPFVTEYKQSPRRGPAPSSEQSFFEREKPSERARPPRLFDLASNESEDSYEAAMRAADALFSLPGNGKAGETRAQPSPKPAQPKAMSAERQAPNVERTPLPDPIPASAAPEKAAGRILRAIDEVPDPKLLALEAEHAPKRRGRKPGSKNKPKPALTTAVALAFDPVEIPEAVLDVPIAPTPLPAASPALAVRTASPLVAAPRGDKKFPWVRDRLRPGEDWKRRRLPRVCW